MGVRRRSIDEAEPGSLPLWKVFRNALGISRRMGGELIDVASKYIRPLVEDRWEPYTTNFKSLS